jgi:hydrogenase-4 component B
MTGALALACFVKVLGIVLLGLPRTEMALRAHECGWLMRVPMLVLAALCLAIGLGPWWIWPAIARAAQAWRPTGIELPLPPSLVTLGAWHVTLVILGALAAAAIWLRSRRNGIRRAVTWDCGYDAPTPRMQYTVGSFAGIVTHWFAWVLRPQRHADPPTGLFPARASHVEHSSETVLQYVVEPAARAVLVISMAARRLQHGRLQAYIFYLVAGLAALALLAVAGGVR